MQGVFRLWFWAKVVAGADGRVGEFRAVIIQSLAEDAGHPKTG